MEREKFLTWSESVLHPCAVPGAQPNGVMPYRHVRIGPRQYLGVDALHDGTLRVYLYSNHAPIKTRWLQLKHAVEGSPTPANLDPLPPGSHSRFYSRDNGEQQRGFFGFEWKQSSDTLEPEKAPLSQYVTWLIQVARKG